MAAVGGIELNSGAVFRTESGEIGRRSDDGPHGRWKKALLRFGVNPFRTRKGVI